MHSYLGGGGGGGGGLGNIRIDNECEGRIEQSVSRDHLLSTQNTNQNCLCQFREIPWNQTKDVHQ